MTKDFRPALASPAERRAHYGENVRAIVNATAELDRHYWGEDSHFAVFEPGETDADFAAALARTHSWYLATIAPALRDRRPARLLDVGCGGGAFTAWLAAHTRAQVLGIDIADAPLARAAARVATSRPAARAAAGAGAHAAALAMPEPEAPAAEPATECRAGGAPPATSRLCFRIHDAMRLDGLAEGPFDAAVCVEVGCYLPDRAAMLGQLAASLRPGGRVLLVDWCRAEYVSALHEEFVLEPLARLTGMPAPATIREYRNDFAAACLRVTAVDDLSEAIGPNWTRACRLANAALAHPPRPDVVVGIVTGALRYGAWGGELLTLQLQRVLLGRTASEAGVLRYVCLVAERT